MKKRSHRKRLLGLLAAGGLVLQFGGCSLDAAWNRLQVGFMERIGAISAEALLDLFDLVDSDDLTLCLGGMPCEE